MGFLRFYGIILITLSFSFCFAQNEKDYLYERNSMHMMIIKHLNQKYDDIIEQVFRETPFPERFNDHNLGVKVISFAENDENMKKNIESFIEQTNLGQKMIAKWFNRNKQTGSFNMELVKERGFYNATQEQINEARKTIRGLALLEDAGENLIKHTYLLVNDMKYNSKGNGSWFLGAIGSIYGINADGINKSMQGIGGFEFTIHSCLFRLIWNNDIANRFYEQYYTENGTSDQRKVDAFNVQKDLFRMEYVGEITSNTKEVNFSRSKDPKGLFVKILTRAIDENIANLQHSFPDFRIKAPLLMEDSKLYSYVGKKEDIQDNSRFEVLERILDENGRVLYKQVGIIVPEKGKIWDNRFMAAEDNEDGSDLCFTTFTKVSGKDFFPGMLIREIK